MGPVKADWSILTGSREGRGGQGLQDWVDECLCLKDLVDECLCLKDLVDECLCLGDDCAGGPAQEGKPGSVSSAGPANRRRPYRAAGRQVCPRGTGSALSRVTQAGPAGQPGEAGRVVSASHGG